MLRAIHRAVINTRGTVSRRQWNVNDAIRLLFDYVRAAAAAAGRYLLRINNIILYMEHIIYCTHNIYICVYVYARYTFCVCMCTERKGRKYIIIYSEPALIRPGYYYCVRRYNNNNIIQDHSEPYTPYLYRPLINIFFLYLRTVYVKWK